MKKLMFFLLVICYSTICFTPTFAETKTSIQQEQQKTVIAKKIILSEKEFDSIEKLEIMWARGQVTVKKSPDNKVYITQKAYVMPKETEVVGVSIKNDTLYIKDYNSLSNLSIENCMNTEQMQKLLQEYHNTEYDLELELPEKEYKEFYFKTVNADCNITNNVFAKVITETINGNVEFHDIVTNSIISNTINGNIVLYPDITTQQYHLETINGNIEADFSIFPESLYAHTINGDIILTLPENDGFFINKNNIKNHQNLSTSFYLKYTTTKKIYKNAKTELDISSINGLMLLKRQQNT